MDTKQLWFSHSSAGIEVHATRDQARRQAEADLADEENFTNPTEYYWGKLVPYVEAVKRSDDPAENPHDWDVRHNYEFRETPVWAAEVEVTRLQARLKVAKRTARAFMRWLAGCADNRLPPLWLRQAIDEVLGWDEAEKNDLKTH